MCEPKQTETEIDMHSKKWVGGVREVEVVVESWEEARHPHCSNVAVAHVQVCHTPACRVEG